MIGTGGIVGGALVAVGISYGILKEEHTTSIRNNGNRGLWNSKSPGENLKRKLENQKRATDKARRKTEEAAEGAAVNRRLQNRRK